MRGTVSPLELLFFPSEVVLLFPDVPMQTLGQALKPVTHRVPETDGGERVTRGSDADADTYTHTHTKKTNVGYASQSKKTKQVTDRHTLPQ